MRDSDRSRFQLPLRAVAHVQHAPWMLLLAVAACTPERVTSPPLDSHADGPRFSAEVDLAASDATLVQTGETAWTLEKTGIVNTVNSTVTWSLTATEIATVPGQLVVRSQLAVANTGTSPATLGNIVVNLQARTGKTWVTRSSDIANATQGDAATTAHVVESASSEKRSSFSENSASGELQLTNESTQAPFSLVPQVSIPAGGTVTLLLSATFDNTDPLLELAVGTATRAEIIVSFGNAAVSKASATNIDINGNGVIDADEARVRSVPTRLGFEVPTQIPAGASVTLIDTADDITTTGTVTFSNAVFDLGATTGTVSVSYNAGASGGTITNCAHLTGANSLACDTQTIGAPPTCTPGTPGCGWQTGDLVTLIQLGWNNSTSWFSAYNTIYSSTFGVVEVGLPGAAGFSMRFSGPTFVTNYLVAVGTPGPLNADLVNPTTSSSGVFGGEVLALRLNVDFSAAGELGGSAGVAFGSLTLCNMTDGSLNGLTVSGFLSIVNTLLGGGSTGHSIASLSPITMELNGAFADGVVSTFAQNNLVNGACP